MKKVVKKRVTYIHTYVYLLIIVTTIAVFGALTTIGASAVTFGTAPYEYNGEKGVAIIDFGEVNLGETVTIPAEIDGKPVLSLGLPGATSHIPGAEKIGALDLSYTGVKVIEANAFERCTNLNGAIESNTVEKVGNMAFFWCKKLTSVKFYVCNTIGESAFLQCTKLTDVTLAEGCKIGANAFSVSPAKINYVNSYFDTAPYEYNGEKGLAIKGFGKRAIDENGKVTIPAKINGQKVLSLGLPDATDHIPGAENIVFLDLSQTGVKVIEQRAFKYCQKLKGTIESDTVEKIEEGAFVYCGKIKSVNTPNLISIKQHAFNGCYKLEDVNLPSNCTIEWFAFYGTPASGRIEELYPSYDNGDPDLAFYE